MRATGLASYQFPRVGLRYTEDAIVHQGILSPGITFLHKPFTPGELARKVRLVLDEAIRQSALVAK
jgi:hypothetical protein